MDLSIIIVSWNVREKLRENLLAIYKSEGGLNFEIFVIDNNSSDGSTEMVENEFPRVNLIKNKENFGFAKANNQGIKQACGDFILLLNPDMKIFADTLISMVNWMRENKQASVAGCRLVDKKGDTVPYVRRFPRLFDQSMIVLKIPHLFPSVLNKYLMKDFNYGKEAEVDSIRGSFFMIRREVIKKLDGLDERYFVWFEEVDCCRQIKNSGYKVMYTSVAKCIDYVGQSFAQVKRGAAQKYFRDSMLKYFKKWHPAWQYWILKILWQIGLLIARAGDSLRLKK